jgi:hypothetical protein
VGAARQGRPHSSPGRDAPPPPLLWQATTNGHLHHYFSTPVGLLRHSHSGRLHEESHPQHLAARKLASPRSMP